MPDTVTDYLDIGQGLAEAERRSPGCIKIIHHPSDCRWRMEDFARSHEGGVRFFELNPCDEDVDYEMALWDGCLSAGLDFFATLSTDAHGWRGVRRWGYVMVRARSLSQPDILSALSSGDFVAMTEGCRAAPVKIDRSYGEPGQEYVIASRDSSETRFIGPGGKTLRADGEVESAYVIGGDEVFVRAEVTDDQGLKFITQPVMVQE